jgi:hypothetical protein
MQTSAPNRFTRNGKITKKHDPPPQQIVTASGNVKHAQRVEIGLADTAKYTVTAKDEGPALFGMS